ncbi:MAG: N-acyl homoserine lactonase family protein [Rhodobiaceae bacterium]|nr:N-acyl homoserine lactonase family protein [Rhodobiaceae bacterium]
MKMHILNGGRLRMKKRIYVPDAERDETIELPVHATLFRHARGNVLFDTGCHPDVEVDAEARWGGLAKIMTPIAAPKSDVVSSLSQVGLNPDDIDIVINSHLHPDHCGCNAFFRKAQFICHKAELAAADSDGAEARGYLRADWDLPMPVEAIDAQHDVFGDSRLVAIPLPGHTPGLIGLHAGLDRTGEVFAVSDAVSLMRNLDRDEIPRNAWDSEKLLESYIEIRRRRLRGAMILCGHDDEQWRQLRKGAEAYE